MSSDPIPLNAEQLAAIHEWAIDDRLWGSRATTEFNLCTFARKILAAVPSSLAPAAAEGPQDATAVKAAACLDCGRDYADFPMDVLLPRWQWLLIHPDEGGLLCAHCIVTRAAKIPGAVGLHAVIGIVPAAALAGERTRAAPPDPKATEEKND